MAGVFLAGKAWPDLEAPLWAVSLGAIGYHICREEKKPVNYRSIKWLVRREKGQWVCFERSTSAA